MRWLLWWCIIGSVGVGFFGLCCRSGWFLGGRRRWRSCGRRRLAFWPGVCPLSHCRICVCTSSCLLLLCLFTGLPFTSLFLSFSGKSLSRFSFTGFPFACLLYSLLHVFLPLLLRFLGLPLLFFLFHLFSGPLPSAFGCTTSSARSARRRASRRACRCSAGGVRPGTTRRWVGTLPV